MDRLCQPIEGLDSVLLAEYLGLDSSKFRHIISNVADEEETLTSFATVLSEQERYKDAERLQLCCGKCASEFEFRGVVAWEDAAGAGKGEADKENRVTFGMQCSSCGTPVPSGLLQRQLARAIHRHLTRFHEYWLVCEESMCGARSRDQSVHGDFCLNAGCQGRLRMEYSNTQLYNQLSYYKNLVDVEAWIKRQEEQREEAQAASSSKRVGRGKQQQLRDITEEGKMGRRNVERERERERGREKK